MISIWVPDWAAAIVAFSAVVMAVFSILDWYQHSKQRQEFATRFLHRIKP